MPLSSTIVERFFGSETIGKVQNEKQMKYQIEIVPKHKLQMPEIPWRTKRELTLERSSMNNSIADDSRKKS